MKVIWIMVSSINGKSTRGNDPDIYSWTSKEDSNHFFRLLNDNDCIVMGSGTYLAAKDKIKPTVGKLRVVLTKEPSRFDVEQIDGQLEFSNDTPEELIKKLETRGFKQLLLVSGAAVGTSFLQQGLIDQLFLTIEPKLFGKGRPLILDTELNIDLQLLSMEKLNEAGTVLLKYQVKK